MEGEEKAMSKVFDWQTTCGFFANETCLYPQDVCLRGDHPGCLEDRLRVKHGRRLDKMSLEEIKSSIRDLKA